MIVPNVVFWETTIILVTINSILFNKGYDIKWHTTSLILEEDNVHYKNI